MHESGEYKKEVEKTVDFLRSRIQKIPEILVQLGTGLGNFSEQLEIKAQIPYAEIPGFPQSTVTSHAGNLIFGSLGGKRIAVLQGRFHYYEGYSAREVAFPIRVLSLLGVKTAIITNASGGLNPFFTPGTIMVFRDHLNMLGENPLRGPNVDEWGPRFPDLSKPYDESLHNLALETAKKLNNHNVRSGVYVCIPGPSLETPAETRFLRQSGADAVGMSTIPEVIVAIHGGVRVLGLSVVANVNDPNNFQPILLEDVIANAEKAGPKLDQLIINLLQRL